MQVPTQQDPRELLMWNNDVTPNKQEISNLFERRKSPLCVYIPKGNVRVPSIRSKHIRQLEARGNRLANASPHLLMVRPEDKNYDTSLSKKHCSSRLSGIPAKLHKREKISQYEAQYRMYNLKNFVSSERLSTTKSEYTRHNATSVATFENIPPLTIQAENVPRPAATSKTIEFDMMKKSSHCYDRIPLATNHATFMPPAPIPAHEMQVREYYERLSQFAAMAWSDCNQATEKLRRIYEETSRISRACNALGFLPYPIHNSTGIMTPTAAAGCGLTNDVFITPQRHHFSHKQSTQHPESNHHALCTCPTCEMTRNSKFKVQQLQQTTHNPPAGDVSTNCKEPLHGIVVNHCANYGDDTVYRKYVDGQCNRNNCAPTHFNSTAFTPSRQGVKRRINDTQCNNSNKMAKLEPSNPKLNNIKSKDKLVDAASRYFQNSASLFGNLLNAQNGVDLTPTLSAHYASNSDLTNGCRRSDTSKPSSLCSFDDQRLPCVSSSPSDQLNAPMQGFGSHSIFPPTAFGMIRTPVVNFNHLA